MYILWRKLLIFHYLDSMNKTYCRNVTLYER